MSRVPKVTVLVPVYNGAALVGGAIESVLGQTFEDFELLLIDDCSTDDSACVIQSFGDPRIRLVRNDENLGQIRSLNRGLREARGEYLARLDQDDRCFPTRLERQVAVLDREPRVGLVGSWMTIVDEDHRTGWLEGEMNDYVDFVFDALTNQLRLGHPSVTFRRDVALELGGYDESIHLAEDKDLWRRFLLAGHEARIVPEPLVLYLLHSAQQSQRNANEQQASDARGYDRFIRELAPNIDPEPTRLLLTWNPDYWRFATNEDIVDELHALIAGSVHRLMLNADEQRELERRLRDRIELAARRSWRHSVRGHWRAAPGLHAFAIANKSEAERRRAHLHFAAVAATAPALKALYLVKRGIKARKKR